MALYQHFLLNIYELSVILLFYEYNKNTTLNTMISGKSFMLILLASAIVFGYTYCLDLFQALQVHFRQSPYEFTTLQFNLMYFFTYLPIFLFNIPIGTVIDRNQITVSLLVLLIMSLTSQLVQTLMLQYQITGYIAIMYLMRCFFGLAGQGIFTVQSIIITNYCNKADFEIVMSVALSLPFLFDSLNSLVTTKVYDLTNSMSLPWYLGVVVCGISLIAGLVIYKMYIRAHIKKNYQIDLRESLLTVKSQQYQGKVQKQKQQQKQSGFNIIQFKSLPYVFWILMVSSFFTQICLGSFNDNLNDLLVKRFNIPYVDAGLILVIPFSFLTILSIIFSVLMSKYPRTRRPLYLISTALSLIGLILLYVLPQTNEPTAIYYVVICFFCFTMSFGFSIYYSGILAAVPYVVKKHTVGTAFGVVGSMVGLSQISTPFMNIAIINSDDDLAISYKRLTFAYIFIALVSYITAIYIQCGPFQILDKTFQELQDRAQQEKKRKIQNERIKIEGK